MSIKARRGRPPKPKGEKYLVVGVSMSPDMAIFAREHGDGSVSRGVQRALIAAHKRKGKSNGR